jgi:hypothetical protein
VFEDAFLDVGVNVQYENERLVEINVVLPHDYEEPESNATIESTVYIGVAEARVILTGLQTAITRAEKELARRAAKSERNEKKPARRKIK